MKIRIVTYNIHKCIGGLDRKCLPDRIRQTIAPYDPDFVLLQEVGESCKSNAPGQVDVLGDMLGMRHRVFFPNCMTKGGGNYGNAILSRFPLTEATNIDLTVPPGKHRSVLHARFRVRRGGKTRTVHLFNIHLGLAQYLRDRQLRQYLASPPMVHLNARTPMILAGDFNDIWGNLGRKHLVPAGFRSMARGVRTFPSWAPFEALDWIYVRGNIELLDVTRSHLKIARVASDHLPLIAELKIG